MVHKKTLVLAFSSCINTQEYLIWIIQKLGNTNQRNKEWTGTDRKISPGLFWRFLLQFVEE